MKLREIMTPDVACVGPEDTLREAAEKMRSLGVGPVPVCENDRLVGILTDRDISSDRHLQRNPWTPVWSCGIFIVVMVALGCWLIEKREF